MSMTKKVLLVTPYAKDANSFWRCVGPWSYLRKMMEGELEIEVAQDSIGLTGVAWDVISQFDLVFFHRPCRPDDLTMLQIAKNLQVPTWIDYDDWLFDVPNWNPNGATYHNAGLQNIMANMIACADVISVSTSALYNKFFPLNKNTVIIPNGYRSDLFPYRGEVQAERNKIFFWRGTNTHDADLLSVADGFKSLHAKTHFLGGPYWGVLNQMPKDSFQVLGSQDNFIYMKYLWDLRPKVLLFPLVDCFFNQCKSNIAYMEALHAGAVCVAPDMPEWHRPGVITYKPGDAQSFEEAANQAIEVSDKEHSQIVSQSYNHMKELYDISVVSHIRVKLLEALFSKSFEKNQRDPYDQLTAMWALSKLKHVPMVQVSQEQLQKKGLSS